jgi:hypothetical protein
MAGVRDFIGSPEEIFFGDNLTETPRDVKWDSGNQLGKTIHCGNVREVSPHPLIA